jgi:hypothetical protein
LVQLNRELDLVENEVAFKLAARTRERLCATRYDDHVRMHNTLLLQKLLHRAPNALIEAAKHGSVGRVVIGRRIEVENFAHGDQAYPE